MKYLDRLRAGRAHENQGGSAPTEPTKPASVSVEALTKPTKLGSVSSASTPPVQTGSGNSKGSKSSGEAESSSHFEVSGGAAGGEHSAALDTPMTAGRQERIDKATRLLRESPRCRAAFVGQESGLLIPVTVVIRTPQGLVTGELAVSKERWDRVLFFEFLEDQERRSTG